MKKEQELTLHESASVLMALTAQLRRKNNYLTNLKQQINGQKAQGGKLTRDNEIQLYAFAHNTAVDCQILEKAIEKLKGQHVKIAINNLPPICTLIESLFRK